MAEGMADFSKKGRTLQSKELRRIFLPASRLSTQTVKKRNFASRVPSQRAIRRYT
jgi:hypothetical protein